MFLWRIYASTRLLHNDSGEGATKQSSRVGRRGRDKGVCRAMRLHNVLSVPLCRAVQAPMTGNLRPPVKTIVPYFDLINTAGGQVKPNAAWFWANDNEHFEVGTLKEVLRFVSD